MGRVNIPFSPYDFFGYLASGFLVLFAMEFILGYPPLLGQTFTAVETVALIMAAYVAGQIVAMPSKAILEDLIVGRILSRPNVNLVREKRPVIRGLIFPGFYSRLPSGTRGKLLEKVKTEGGAPTGEDLFLHIRFSPQVLQDAKLMERLNSFLNLYGFNRNLCFAGLVVGVSMCLVGRYSHPARPELIHYGLTIGAAGVILFYRYLKFFRQYSYELFSTYARAKQV